MENEEIVLPNVLPSENVNELENGFNEVSQEYFNKTVEAIECEQIPLLDKIEYYYKDCLIGKVEQSKYYLLP